MYSPSIGHQSSQGRPYPWILSHSCHGILIVLPPTIQERWSLPTVGLEQVVRLHHLQPPLWLQQNLQLLHVVGPTVCVNAVCQEATIDQVVRLGL